MVVENELAVKEMAVKVCMAEPFQKDFRRKKPDRMYLRQNNFPYMYKKGKDLMLAKNHNQCLMQDRWHASSCLERHAKTSEMALDKWILTASDEQIVDFLKDILKADQEIDWTGYRVLVSRDHNGHPIWFFELFAKHPESTIGVYSGQKAPNVMLGPRG